MRRFTNLALATLLTLALVTGLTTQTIGTGAGRAVAFTHGLSGLALLVLTPWKSVTIKAGVRRRGAVVASFALLASVLITIASGLAQAGGLVTKIGPLGIMQVHIGAAALATLLLAAHYLRHPVRPRPTDLSRRNFLRLGTVGAGAAATVALLDSGASALGWRRADRRFTGSHERGSGDPAAMPVTQWFLDSVPREAHTQITIAGERLALDDLMQLPMSEFEATLDCTSGWYATQRWRGVRLDQLVDPGGATSVVIGSVTGYARRFPAADLGHMWLAVEAAGRPLSPGHGGPVRLVAPGRRGFWWVKWVDSIQPSNVPAWLQVPFPIR